MIYDPERRRRFLNGWTPAYPFTVTTLRDYVYVRYGITVRCPECPQERDLDLIALAERYGPDTPLDAVLRALRCQGCGRKGRPDVTVQRSGDSRERD